MFYKHWEKIALTLTAFFWASCSETTEDKVSETANSRADAKYIACAAVNKSNEQATTIRGEVWPEKKIVAGACIELQSFGKANGKYYLDKVTLNVTPSGTSYNIEAHKCYTRLRRV